jgi:hypothetical protein
MRKEVFTAAVLLCLAAGSLVYAGEPSVTVYNQNFAVVRDTIHLDLKKGVNEITCNDITVQLEPDSVMLRDPAGRRQLQIIEQNYCGDPVSQGLLLMQNEGKTIEFLVTRGENQEIKQGKVIRSGYVPHGSAMARYGQQFYEAQSARSQGGGSDPIIEMDGKVRFGLPGLPIFPPLEADTIMKPTLSWLLESDSAGPLEAELGYVTGGMRWEATYNLVAPEKDAKLDMVAWVTVDNQSGKTFENARLKLMAGDVNKLVQMGGYGGRYADINGPAAMGALGGGPPMTEKSFDEYHLYTVERATTLQDRETKQIEMLRAQGVKSERFYVYDGVRLDPNQNYDTSQLMQQQEYGTQSRTDVWVMREIKNTKENGLGVPLPAGRTRFYQRDDDGQLEFTGENRIKHTPRDETFRVYTGTAFDLVGNRKRTEFKCDYNQHWVDETFEISLRNRKKEMAEIRVVEHLYRGVNWEIKQSSEPYNKMESQTIEFRVQLKPGEEKAITYTVHYTW